jgi:hypothetical protein
MIARMSLSRVVPWATGSAPGDPGRIRRWARANASSRPRTVFAISCGVDAERADKATTPAVTANRFFIR